MGIVKGGRNRFKTDARREIDAEECSLYQALFQECFVGATYNLVKPFYCIRIVDTPPSSLSGDRRLLSLFPQSCNHLADMGSFGFMHETDTPTIVGLREELRYFVYDNFRRERLSEEEIEAEVAWNESWYNVIDGGHSHEAMKEIKSEVEELNSFQWFTTLVNWGQPIEKYGTLQDHKTENTHHAITSK